MADEHLTVIEAIRRRPAMYTGSTSVCGFNELLRYLVVYSLEDLKAKEFSFRLASPRGGEIAVSNIGSPVSDIIVSNPIWSGSGLGTLSVVTFNALSEHFHIQLLDVGGKPEKGLAFEKGILKTGSIEDRFFSPSAIRIEFDLDETVWEIPEPLNPYFYLGQFETLAYLNKNKTITLGWKMDGKENRAAFRFEHGLKDMIDLRKVGSKFSGTVHDVYFEHHFAEFTAEAAFGFWETSVNEPFLVSFVNHERTHENGVHLDAMLDGIERALSRFAADYNLSDEYFLNRRGLMRMLLGAVRVISDKPHFEGAVRNNLQNPEMKEPLASLVAEKLFAKLMASPNYAVCTVKQVARESRIAKHSRE